MTEINWSTEGKKVFEKIIDAIPETMREMLGPKLLELLASKAKGEPVSPELIIQMVQDDLPEPQKSVLLDMLTQTKELGDFDINVIENTIARHGTDQDKLMYILHDIQDEMGYLPVEALRAVSNKSNIPLSTIYNIVTFYKSFRLYPQKKHHVKICMGTACYLKDTENISREIDQKISSSSDTTLEKTLCLGCCDCAPVVEIDGKTYNSKDAKLKINSL